MRNKIDILLAFTIAIGFWSTYVFGYWFVAITESFSSAHSWFKFSGAVSLVLLLSIVASRLRRKSPTIKTVVNTHSILTVDFISTAILVVVASFEVFSSIDEPIPRMCCISACSLAYCWQLHRWWNLFSSVSTDSLIIGICTGIIMASCFKFFMALLPEAFSYIGLILPVLSALGLQSCILTKKISFDQGNTNGHLKNKSGLFPFEVIKSLWTVWSAMTLFFLAWGYSNAVLKVGTGHYGFGPTSSPALSAGVQLIDALIALFLLWWVFFKRKRLGYVALWRVVYVCFSASFLIVEWSGTVQAAQILTSASFVIAFALVDIGCANIAHHSNYPPVELFGSCMFIQYFGDWLGRCLVTSLEIERFDVHTAAVLLFGTVIVMATFLSKRSIGESYVLSDLNGYIPASSPNDLEERCHSVGLRYGLSQRETEIACLLCQGRSRPYIAENLILSENTVATYIRRLYTKLSVHNKQELIDLISNYIQDS